MFQLKVVKSAAKAGAIATTASSATAATDHGQRVTDDIATDKGRVKGNVGSFGVGGAMVSFGMHPHHCRCLFASIEAAFFMLKEVGLYFIGSIKQCTKRFSMEILGKNSTTLPKQGSQLVLAFD